MGKYIIVCKPITAQAVLIVLIVHLFQITFINTLRSAVFVRGDEVTIIVM